MSIKHWAQNKVLRTAYKGKEKVQYFSGTYQDLQQKTLSYVFAAYTVESYRTLLGLHRESDQTSQWTTYNRFNESKRCGYHKTCCFEVLPQEAAVLMHKLNERQQVYPQQSHKINITSSPGKLMFSINTINTSPGSIRSPTLQICHTTGQWLQRAGIVTDQSSLSAECPPHCSSVNT